MPGHPPSRFPRHPKLYAPPDGLPQTEKQDLPLARLARTTLNNPLPSKPVVSVAILGGLALSIRSLTAPRLADLNDVKRDMAEMKGVDER